MVSYLTARFWGCTPRLVEDLAGPEDLCLLPDDLVELVPRQVLLHYSDPQGRDHQVALLPRRPVVESDVPRACRVLVVELDACVMADEPVLLFIVGSPQGLHAVAVFALHAYEAPAAAAVRRALVGLPAADDAFLWQGGSSGPDRLRRDQSR